MDPYINLKVSDFKWSNYDVLTNPEPIPEQTKERKNEILMRRKVAHLKFGSAGLAYGVFAVSSIGAGIIFAAVFRDAAPAATLLSLGTVVAGASVLILKFAYSERVEYKKKHKELDDLEDKVVEDKDTDSKAISILGYQDFWREPLLNVEIGKLRRLRENIVSDVDRRLKGDIELDPDQKNFLKEAIKAAKYCPQEYEKRNNPHSDRFRALFASSVENK